MASKQNVRLGVKSLTDLKKYLENYKKELNLVEMKVVEDLVAVGTAELNNRLSTIPNYDGNTDWGVESYAMTHQMGKSIGVISEYGPQVVFLEFGTGIPGQNTPHPQADDIGYLYNQKHSEHAHRTVNGVEGWFYKPDGEDKAVFTPGIRGGQQMWGTALQLRRLYIPMTKRAIKRIK